MENDIAIQIESFYKSEDYKTVCRINETPAKYSKTVIEQTGNIYWETKLKLSTFQVDISSSYQPLDRVERYREQVLAPLFSLGFGLLIFCADEIGFNITSPSPQFIMTVFLVTILAIAYWISIWGAFLYHSGEEHEKRYGNSWWHSIQSVIGIRHLAIDKMILSLIVYALLMYVGPWYYLNSFGKVIYTLFSYSFPVMVFGGIRIWNCSVKGYYSYAHALGHLLAITVYAIIAGIIFANQTIVEYGEIPYLVNVEILRTFIVGFLLINGVVFPFLLPYGRSYQLFSTKKREITRNDIVITNHIQTFPKEYEKICAAIGREQMHQISGSSSTSLKQSRRRNKRINGNHR
jgi:hypothetical protein